MTLATRKTLDHDAVQALLSAFRDDTMRDLALWIAHTGARLSELARLRWLDVDLTGPTVEIPSGKTAGRRRVPLSAELVRWCSERRAAADRNAAILAVGRQFLGALRAAGQTAGLGRVGLVCLRLFTMHRWLEDGCDRDQVARWFGHGTEHATRRRARVASEGAIVRVLQRRARRLLRAAALGAATTEDAVDALLPLFTDLARGVVADDAKEDRLDA